MESLFEDLMLIAICVLMFLTLYTFKSIDTSLGRIANSIENNTVIENKENNL